MQAESRPPPTVVFTVRLWREPLGSGRSEWRSEIKNLSTGEVRYARLWEEIAALIPEMLGEDPAVSSQERVLCGR